MPINDCEARAESVTVSQRVDYADAFGDRENTLTSFPTNVCTFSSNVLSSRKIKFLAHGREKTTLR